MKSHGDEVTVFYDKRIPVADSNHTCLVVISLDSALKEDGNFYLQVFLKGSKYIEKKVITHINYSLSNFSFTDESDEEQIKAIRLMIFEQAILKTYFLECNFCGSNFENVFFGEINFENVFSKRAILEESNEEFSFF